MPKAVSTLEMLDAAYRTSPEALLRYFAGRRHMASLDRPRGAARHVAAANRTVRHIFTFNNETRHLPADFDWLINPSADREWHILLHKFYYLRELGLAYDYTGDEIYARTWVALISSWIASVPAGFIDTQVTGRRLQQWLQSFHYFVPGAPADVVTPAFLLAFLRAVDEQTAYLCAHLTEEGNHRTIELYGIFLVAVTFPELQRANAYLAFAQEELARNLRADFLPDGVHRELSTDYHHIVLKNFLRIRELAQRHGVSLPPDYDQRLQRAIDFSLHVHKPDGAIPAINDGDVNDYRSLLKKSLRMLPNEQVRFVITEGQAGRAPARRSRLFPDSGYFILRSDWRQQPFRDARYLFFDCASLGFGSHGHYDLLNIEFAAYGHALIVDPGRFTYHENGEDGVNWRRRFKSTAYHNTVVIDGKDQCEYHIGRPEVQKPRAEVLRFESGDGFDVAQGRATSPNYAVAHERSVLFLPDDYCLIIDRLEGPGPHTYDQYFHLHPRALGRTSLERARTTTRLLSPNLAIAQPHGATAVLQEGFVSAEYGRKQAAPVLRLSLRDALGTGVVLPSLLYPYAASCPDIDMQPITVRRNGRPCAPVCCSGLRIAIRAAERRWTDYVCVAHEQAAGVYQLDDIAFDGALLWLRIDEAGQVVGMHGVEVQWARYRNQCLSCQNGIAGPRS